MLSYSTGGRRKSFSDALFAAVVRGSYPSVFPFPFDALARPAAGLEVQVEMKLGRIAR